MLITLLSKAFGTESASEEHSAGVLLCAPSWTADFLLCGVIFPWGFVLDIWSLFQGLVKMQEKR